MVDLSASGGWWSFRRRVAGARFCYALTTSDSACMICACEVCWFWAWAARLQLVVRCARVLATHDRLAEIVLKRSGTVGADGDGRLCVVSPARYEALCNWTLAVHRISSTQFTYHEQLNHPECRRCECGHVADGAR